MEIHYDNGTTHYLFDLGVGDTFFDDEIERHYMLIQKMSGGSAILDGVDLSNGIIRNFGRDSRVIKTSVKAIATRIK